MLLPRFITAVIGIPLVLIAVYFGGIPYFLLILIVTLFSLSEYFHILELGQYGAHRTAGYVIGALLLLGVYFGGTKLLTHFENQALSFIITLGLAALFLIEILRATFAGKQPDGSTGRIAVTFFGVFLLSWSFGHLLLLRDLHPYGDRYTFFLFILIWLLDTGAYAAGMKFGKHRLSEQISPKKTVEGTIGGLVTGIIGAMALWYFLRLKEFTLPEISALGFLIVVFAYLSDLSESLLKRDAGMKDSDALLPGHGGILDRFDSFIFTAPFLYYYLWIFHK
jgi:phosphatidate cytidylyltransferase